MAYCWVTQDSSVGDGFARIATEQAAKAVLNADAVGDPPADRIHAARRHCKRLRGLFRLARPDFPDYRKANALVRDAAAHLSAARDARVIRQTLEKLSEWAGLPAPEPAKHHAPNSEDEAAALNAFRGAIGRVVRDAGNWNVDHLTYESIGEGFERCYAQAAKAGKEALQKPDDEAFHDWRKLTKYHSFHLILLKDLLGKDASAKIKRVEQLAAVLGQHHDLAVLRHTASASPQSLSASLDADAVVLNVGRQQDQLAAQAHWLADEIFAKPPKAVRREFEANWQAWWTHADAEEPA
jgi:CHAD domain-containing protein